MIRGELIKEFVNNNMRETSGSTSEIVVVGISEEILRQFLRSLEEQ